MDWVHVALTLCQLMFFPACDTSFIGFLSFLISFPQSWLQQRLLLVAKMEIWDGVYFLFCARAGIGPSSPRLGGRRSGTEGPPLGPQPNDSGGASRGHLSIPMYPPPSTIHPSPSIHPHVPSTIHHPSIPIPSTISLPPTLARCWSIFL